MANTSFKLPANHITLLDELVREGRFTSRGEAIREAIIRLKEELLAHNSQ